MSQETYQSVVLAKRPESHIIAGETFALKTNPIITANDLKDGQVLLETIYLSLEPAMRAWLQEGMKFVLAYTQRARFEAHIKY